MPVGKLLLRLGPLGTRKQERFSALIGQTTAGRKRWRSVVSSGDWPRECVPKSRRLIGIIHTELLLGNRELLAGIHRQIGSAYCDTHAASSESSHFVWSGFDYLLYYSGRARFGAPLRAETRSPLSLYLHNGHNDYTRVIDLAVFNS